METNATCCGCWSGIFGSIKNPIRFSRFSRKGRHYRRARYNEREYSIEFENLIEEVDFKTHANHIVTDEERNLLGQGKYDILVEQQKKANAAIDAELLQQEDDLKLEEETYYQAKKEAAKVATHSKKNKQAEKATAQSKRGFDSEEFSQWLSAEDLEIASPEMDVEDFDSFLEKVKARSLSAKTMKLVDDENSVARQSSWEDTLNLGFEATKIAGEAMSALAPTDTFEYGHTTYESKQFTSQLPESALKPLDEEDDEEDDEDSFEDLL